MPDLLRPRRSAHRDGGGDDRQPRRAVAEGRRLAGQDDAAARGIDADAVGHIRHVPAATRGRMGAAAAVVGLFSAISVRFAVLILRERILDRQYAGLATGGVGVIALSV